MTLSARDNNNADLRSRISALESRVNILPGRIHSDGKPRATWRTFIQEDHEFEVGHIVRFDADDDAWVKSLADTAEHAFYGGMVVSVPTPHTFAIAMPGSYVNGLGDLGIDKGIWYLSATTAGELVDASAGVGVPVLMADSDHSGVLLASASAAIATAYLAVGRGNVIATWNTNDYFGIKHNAGSPIDEVPNLVPSSISQAVADNLSPATLYSPNGATSLVWCSVLADPGTGATSDWAATIDRDAPVISRRTVQLPVTASSDFATVYIIGGLG